MRVLFNIKILVRKKDRCPQIPLELIFFFSLRHDISLEVVFKVEDGGFLLPPGFQSYLSSYLMAF